MRSCRPRRHPNAMNNTSCCDKVFALLGITRSQLKADYEMSIEELYLRVLFEGMTEILESGQCQVAPKDTTTQAEYQQSEDSYRLMRNFGWSLIFALDLDYLNKTVWHITK